MFRYLPIQALFLFCLLTSTICSAQSETPLFKSLSPEITKVNFANTIVENDSFNYFYYDNLYNGAGVSMGDINNDGLPDLYFVSNQGADQLYLNLGGMKFKNITKKAFKNQDISGWHTAVSMADVNADGWLDIYVCKHGIGASKVNFPNLLYINNGNKTFTERGKEFGVNDPGRSMDADFFDYDQDGDLDLLVTNHRENTCIMDQYNHTTYLEQFHSNRLYTNNGDGTFSETTKAAGILSFGFCLSTSIGDVNNDGWPDVYITSDYSNPEFLFINQQNGTFKSEARERLRHTSHYSMGSDIADFNNDGNADVCVLDMSNKDYVKAKTNMGSMSVGTFLDNVAKGFNYQYMYNTLQLNLGSGYFSEIAHMAGIASTDWSWAPLLVDFDQDGLKDIFATNGYFKEVRNKDFTNTVKEYIATKPEKFDVQKMGALIPQNKEVDFVFKNNGDLTFKDKSADWGLTIGTNSNGAAYGDLDNDGDVDLVINNLNEPATILENTSNKNYFCFKLTGPEKNPFAIGAKVTIKTKNGDQVQELNPSRGYASSSDFKLCFGVGDADTVYSITVQWNATESSTINYPMTWGKIFIDYQNVEKVPAANVYPFVENPKTEFAKITEEEFDDYRREVLLPQKMSQLGPFLSSGYINGNPEEGVTNNWDRYPDLLIGGGKNQKTRIYASDDDDEFYLSKQQDLDKDSAFEDAGSVFFDANNDGYDDLFIVSGGNEYDQFSPYYQHRLYINDEQGNFIRKKDALPKIISSGQCVATNNFDADDDIDLLVPGRQVPGRYLEKPESIWLVNENGKFTNKISAIAPELQYLGMITDAVFTDFDSDGDDDLIVVGEWLAPTFFENKNGSFSKISKLENENSMYGWWNCIEPIDVNNDGVMELLVGNVGLNNKFHPTPEYPLSAQLSDFDSSGTYDLVLSKYFAGVQHPVRGRECLSEQMPEISERFKTYGEFATTPFQEIFSQTVKAEKATNFSNGILILENGKYKFYPFDNFGQIGCINKFIPVDMNGDEYIDFIAFGNKYEAEIETPRYDANPGLVFINEKGKGFKILPLQDFGPFVNKNAKDAILIGNSIFISNSGESVDRYQLW